MGSGDDCKFHLIILHILCLQFIRLRLGRCFKVCIMYFRLKQRGLYDLSYLIDQKCIQILQLIPFSLLSFLLCMKKHFDYFHVLNSIKLKNGYRPFCFVLDIKYQLNSIRNNKQSSRNVVVRDF